MSVLVVVLVVYAVAALLALGLCRSAKDGDRLLRRRPRNPASASDRYMERLIDRAGAQMVELDRRMQERDR